MWNSWTRNFNTPLQALLDLLDNCFDAAMKPKAAAAASSEAASAAAAAADTSAIAEEGGAHLIDTSSVDGEPLSEDETDPDPYQYRGKISIEADMFQRPESGQPACSTGLSVTNNSYRPIKPLASILEAYSSAKGRDEHGGGHFAETIGENGVGLKQGCAVLSNLCFVLVRSEGKLGLGIIAARLQKEEGICLPSYTFDFQDFATLRVRMMQLIGIMHKDTVGQCVTDYGEGSLGCGINRLLDHFRLLMQQHEGGWGNERHAFRLILHDIKGNSGADGVDATADKAAQLMSQANKELPRHYLHVPPDLEVRCGGDAINFSHWQSRLVEMTEFLHNIDPNNPIDPKKENWSHPPLGDGVYPVRILCGFDPVRKDGAQSARLIVYSRHSGRMVLEEEDSRAMLGLSAGSTDFA